MSQQVLGVMGGGQLGRMLAMAAARLGVRTRVFDPSAEACAGDVAELVVGAYDNEGALARFCEGLDAATVEFENVPIDAVTFVQDRVPFYPNARSIAQAQDRLHEREAFRKAGLQTPRDGAVTNEQEIEVALRAMGSPAILKSRRFGYDGKGQAWIREPSDVPGAWERIGQRAALLDEAVSFQRELSLVMVRGRTGEVRHYAATENVHVDGILHTSRAPAEVDASALNNLRQSVEAMLSSLDYVGVVAVEVFDCNGQYLVNEFAPRVHNSGHWTIEGAVTSQFENHVRAVMGLPLGSTDSRGHAGMVNLIGTVGEFKQQLACEGAQFHAYGKLPRDGRKVGHVTVCAETAAFRDARLREVECLVEKGRCHVSDSA